MFGFDTIKLALTGDSAARDRLVDVAKSGKSLVDTFTQLAGGSRSDAQPVPTPSPAATFSNLSGSSSFGLGAGVLALVVVGVLALLWRE